MDQTIAYFTMEIALEAAMPTYSGGLGGLMPMPADVPDMVPNHWAVYFMVDDTDATAELVRASGGQVVTEPFDIPGVGRTAVFHDPHGGSFQTLQPAMG